MGPKDEELTRFGINARKIRKAKGLSQDDVATNSNNLTKSTVSAIENGKRNFEFTTFLDLAKGLIISPLELIKYLEKEDN